MADATPEDRLRAYAAAGRLGRYCPWPRPANWPHGYDGYEPGWPVFAGGRWTLAPTDTLEDREC